MGSYLDHEKLPVDGKAHALMEHFGAQPASLLSLPLSKAEFRKFKSGIVIVVNNGPFDAAAVAYKFEELDRWVNDLCWGTRPYTVLTMDKAVIEDILGEAPWKY